MFAELIVIIALQSSARLREGREDPGNVAAHTTEP